MISKPRQIELGLEGAAFTCVLNIGQDTVLKYTPSYQIFLFSHFYNKREGKHGEPLEPSKSEYSKIGHSRCLP